MKNQNQRNSQAISSTELGKILPQAVDLEVAVLGGAMLEKDALHYCAEKLKPEHFYKEVHQLVFKAILALYSQSNPVDILTVTEQLRKTNELEWVGGAYAITQLTEKISSTGHIEHHIAIIHEKWLRREHIKRNALETQLYYDDSEDVFSTIEDGFEARIKMSQGVLVSTETPFNEILQKNLELSAKMLQNEKEIPGVPSGFLQVDRITGGWMPSDLIIIAARPGMGKSAFVMKTAAMAAIEFKKQVAFFSLEMSKEQLVNRLISDESNVSLSRIIKGQIVQSEFDTMVAKSEHLRNEYLHIYDDGAVTTLQIRSRCHALVARGGLDLIVVDYMQLMRGPSKGNREQEIGQISRDLKTIAKEFDVPVIALSQLSRAVEARGGDKKPQLSDLRESGSIEQDADLVLFLYRPEYYGITTDADGNDLEGLAQLIIAKHRQGALDTIRLKFEGKYTRFSDYEVPFPDSPEPEAQMRILDKDEKVDDIPF